MNFVYCSSDLFAEVCAVSVVSLFENNKHVSDINVFIIEDRISEANKARFDQIAQKYNRSITFIAMPDPGAFYNDERFTFQSLGNTYARMILGDILPHDIDKVISLDSDTIVLGKVDELWNFDLNGHPIAGVDDCMGRIALVKTQHLKEDSVHCNAGMLVVDLETWRKENWTQLFYEYIKKMFDSGIDLGGYEEEVINNILGERMFVLPPKFNLMTLEQVLTYDELMMYRQPMKYYSRQEIEEAKQSPVITHTTNFFYIKKRIFEENSDHPMRPQYEKYRSMTPWADEPAMTAARPTIKNHIMKNVWHWMPKRVSLYAARFVRNHIRPLLSKKRDDE